MLQIKCLFFLSLNADFMSGFGQEKIEELEEKIFVCLRFCFALLKPYKSSSRNILRG